MDYVEAGKEGVKHAVTFSVNPQSKVLYCINNDLSEAESFEAMVISAVSLTVIATSLALPCDNVANKSTVFKDGKWGADIKT